MEHRRLTVKERKLNIENVIRERARGRLSERDLFELVNKLNINNQYTVKVVTNPNEFRKLITMKRTDYFKEVERYIGECGELETITGLSFLGGYEQYCELLKGNWETIQIGVEEEEFVDGKKTSIVNIQNPIIDEDEIYALVITTIKNYLGYDGEDRDYWIRYELVIYIPEEF